MRTDLTRVDIRLAVAVSAPYKDLPVMIACLNPKHKDDTTSMAIYRDHIHCYGCGLTISRRMDSLAYLLQITVYEAIKRAGEFLETTPRTYQKRVELQPLSPAIVRTYESLLWGWRKDRLEWLFNRGLTEEMIRLFQIGHDGTRYTIPVFDRDGKLVSIRYRTDPKSVVRDDPEETHQRPRKYSGLTGRNELRLYPEWFIVGRPDVDFLVVCEGELDAARVWQEGIPAGTPINGAGNLRNIIPLLAPFPWIKRLYIASDMDDAGEKGARELMEEAKRAGMDATRLLWPRAMGKDITELFEWQGTDHDYELFRPILQSGRYPAA